MPRHRASSPRIPRKLLRGQKILDAYTGEEIYSRDSSTRTRDGKAYYKKNYDYLTTEEEIRMWQGMVSGIGNRLSHEVGQGYEVPIYTNLPFYANDILAIAAGLLLGMPYNGPSGFTHVGQNPGNVLYDGDAVLYDGDQVVG